MTKSKAATPFVLLLIFACSFILFYPSLSYYFFQDDWFVLNWVRTGDFLSFFAFRDDVIYWRPLSMPLFFWTNYKLFGLNPLGFHLVAFSIFLILLISIYKLFLILFKDRSISLLGTYFYSTWPIHFMSLSWISTTSYILMSLFQVLSIIFFIKFLEKKKINFWALSWIFFILGIISHEFTVVLPVILLALRLILKKSNHLIFLLPFFIIDFIFFVFRFIIFPIQAEGAYTVHYNYLIADNFLWYIVWAFNFPESFKDLIDQSFLFESFRRLINFWKISLPSLILIVTFIKLLSKYFRKNNKYYLFGFIWFAVGLIPIITLVEHSYTVYLSFAGIGFIYLMLVSLNSSSKIWSFILPIFWLLASLTNLQFTRSTHWIVNEQAISKSYISFIKSTLNDPKEGSIFLIRHADRTYSLENKFVITNKKDISLALNNSSAIQVLFNDSSLKSLFINPLEQVTLPPETTVYEVIPR